MLGVIFIRKSLNLLKPAVGFLDTAIISASSITSSSGMIANLISSHKLLPTMASSRTTAWRDKTRALKVASGKNAPSESGSQNGLSRRTAQAQAAYRLRIAPLLVLGLVPHVTMNLADAANAMMVTFRKKLRHSIDPVKVLSVSALRYHRRLQAAMDLPSEGKLRPKRRGEVMPRLDYTSLWATWHAMHVFSVDVGTQFLFLTALVIYFAFCIFCVLPSLFLCFASFAFRVSAFVICCVFRFVFPFLRSSVLRFAFCVSALCVLRSVSFAFRVMCSAFTHVELAFCVLRFRVMRFCAMYLCALRFASCVLRVVLRFAFPRPAFLLLHHLLPWSFALGVSALYVFCICVQCS